MLVRMLKESDLPKIAEIHRNFYEKEFDFEELFLRNIGVFAVTDENDVIVCVGAVRPIAEVVLITDKEKTVRERRSALFKVLDASEFVAKNSGFDQLHIFVQDDNWIKHLMKNGFKATAGKALVRIL
jgi:hypothetical protein